MAITQDSSHPTGVRTDQWEKGHERPNSTLVVARNRKAQSAVTLRIGGASWAEIATALGYPSAHAALIATEKALAKALHDEDRDVMRKLAGARLERLLRAIYPKALDPENPEQLVAAQRVVQVIDRHARLFGLDAPAEMIVHTPTASEIESWVSVILSDQRASLPAEFDIIDGEVLDAESEA